MNKLIKVVSVGMVAAMLLSAIPFSASAAAKKTVSASNSAKGIKISWKKTAKAGKYKVYRSTSKNKGYKVVGTTTKTTFTDKKAKAGKTYYYTVKTTKAKATYKKSKIVRLTAPTLKSVTAAETGNTVTLKWTKVTGAKTYGIYRAKVVKGKTQSYKYMYSVSGKKEDLFLEKEGTYKFKVVAENGSSKSAFSNVKTLKFVPGPDVVLTVGETDNTIVETIALIKGLGADFGIEIDVTATWEIANPEIISISDDYVITGLSAGETTVNLTLTYDVAGEKNSDTTKIKVLVKKADTSKITEDEAIELVKQEMGEDYYYIPADNLVVRDGVKYYEIYVKKMLDTGSLTTMATYLVNIDGSEVFDKDAAAVYFGDYVNTGVTGVTTFTVSEDGTFEMTTVGQVNQTVLGTYKLGITDSINVVELKLYPKKSIVEDNGNEVEEEISDVEGLAVIKNCKLTLSMESQDTVFTKK